MRRNGTSRTNTFLLVSAIFGIITTIAKYSGYGVSNHIEQLPLVIRALDSSYLRNDFFVNAASSFGPRYYYTGFLATIAGEPERLPAVYLALTLLANVSIAVITFSFGRRLFGKSDRAGAIASALVMSVTTFDLGWLDTIYQTSLLPSTLSTPMIFMAVMAAVSGHLVLGMILSGIASIFHPLFGLETAGLLIVSYSASRAIANRESFRPARRAVLISVALLAAALAMWVLPGAEQGRISSDTFVEILAFFRHPQHYVPSTFDLDSYAAAVGFVTASLIAWHWWQRTEGRTSGTALRILILGASILVLCLGGYVFVEVMPSRLWVTAQPLRLLYLVKWMGLVLIGGTTARLLQSHMEASAGLLLTSTMHPLAMGVAVSSQWAGGWVKRYLPALGSILQPTPMLLLTVTLLLTFSRVNYLLLGYFLLFCAVDSFPRRYIFALVVAGLLFTSLKDILRPYAEFLPVAASSLKELDKNLALDAIQSELGVYGDGVAQFARRSTPEDSVFLTPPLFGQFRLLAYRAIVVDFKAFPFQDDAMLEWYRRMADCYGVPNARGWQMVPELEQTYRSIADEELRTLRDRYGISYAVLFEGTPTGFPVVYENQEYKVVVVEKEVP